MKGKFITLHIYTNIMKNDINELIYQLTEVNVCMWVHKHHKKIMKKEIEVK